MHRFDALSAGCGSQEGARDRVGGCGLRNRPEVLRARWIVQSSDQEDASCHIVARGRESAPAPEQRAAGPRYITLCEIGIQRSSDIYAIA